MAINDLNFKNLLDYVVYHDQIFHSPKSVINDLQSSNDPVSKTVSNFHII